jgi:Septum formation
MGSCIPLRTFLGADDRARENMVSKGCEDVVAPYLGLPGGKVTNRVLGWSFSLLTQNEWQRGDRTVRCFAVGFKGASSNGVRFTGSVKDIGNRAPT